MGIAWSGYPCIENDGLSAVFQRGAPRWTRFELL
jgi:hypothetical protein